MAGKIKAISKFSEDAISVALDTLSEEEWKSFERGLNVLTRRLGEKKAKQGVVPNKMSDEVMFNKNVVPSIYQRINEIEKREIEHKLSIDINFDIKTDFGSFTLEEIMSEHAKIIMREEGMKSLTLFTQYSRGLLYMELVDRLQKRGQGLKEFLETSGMLKVSYMTALRYITLASIILKLPRLILCQLSFTQILKHKKRLFAFLESDEGQDLNSKLALPVEIVAQGKPLQILHAEMSRTNIKFSCDPDWEFQDAHNKVELSDENLQDWVASREYEDEEAALNQTMRKCKLKDN